MARLIDITGKTLSGEWGNDDIDGTGIPVLRTTNFTNDGVVNFDSVVTRSIVKKDLTQKFLQPGDIIIEKSGGSDKQPVGRVVYYEGPEATYLFNNFTGVLRVKAKDKWLPRYVFYALFANYAQGGTKRYENRTTGLHNLQTDQYVADFQVNEASIESQIECVSVLDRVTNLISLRKQQIAKLDELVKSRFIELFGCGSYPIFRLGDVCTKITDGTHKTPNYLDSGVTFISAKNIVNGELDFTDVKYISGQEYAEIQKRCQTEMGDILLSKSGSLGAPAIVKTDDRIGLFESLAVLKYDRNRLLAAFLCEQLKSDKVQRQFRVGTKGVAIKHLHLGVIADTEIIVPPIEEQTAFVTFVKQTNQQKLTIQQSLDKLEMLKKALMQKYFG